MAFFDSHGIDPHETCKEVKSLAVSGANSPICNNVIVERVVTMIENFLSIEMPWMESDALDPNKFNATTGFRGLGNPIQGTVFGPDRIGSMNSLHKQIALRGLSPGALEQH